MKGGGIKMRGVAPLSNSPLYFDKMGSFRGAELLFPIPPPLLLRRGGHRG
jgi:hypothetical protein